jgi:caa(3)-type oxidase subunit IV
MAGAHADISKHIKVYLIVFAALAAGTIITVAAARVDFGGHVNVMVALAIAAVKATLVAAIFMHLKWEKSMWIWYSLGLCAIFFAFLMALPTLTTHDTPALTENRTWDVTANAVEPEPKGETHVPGH